MWSGPSALQRPRFEPSQRHQFLLLPLTAGHLRDARACRMALHLDASEIAADLDRRRLGEPDRSCTTTWLVKRSSHHVASSLSNLFLTVASSTACMPLLGWYRRVSGVRETTSEGTGSVAPAPTTIRIKGCLVRALGQDCAEGENAVTGCHQMVWGWMRVRRRR